MNLTVKGAEAMNYRIEGRNGEDPQTPAKLWKQSIGNSEVKRLSQDFHLVLYFES